MTTPTSLEQLYLELINDARLDPLGNAARYITSYSPLTSSDPDIQSALSFFNVGGTALQAAFAALTPVQPLAWNDALGTAARTHSDLMIANDDQSHQLPGEANLSTRITAAGYTGWSAVAENIFAYSESALHGHAGFMVDWGGGPDGMQSPPGHRNSIMSASYREIGIGVVEESNGSTSVGPQVVTQDFGARFSGPVVLVLGVTYTDSDASNFYSLGEGAGGMTVAVGAASAVSAASGGYTLGLAAGTHAITFSGGLLPSTATFTATLASGTNAKIDIVGGTTLKTSVSGTVAGPITRIEALGTLGLSLTAGDGDQTIVGTGGGDTLTGGAGNDTLEGRAGIDTLNGGANNDVLIGGDGADALTGSTGNDTFRFLSATDSTRAAPDAITDFLTGDVLQFMGIAGVGFRSSPYPFITSATQTVDAIVADSAVTNAYVHFTDGVDVYLYVKGAGSGVSFNQTFIELSGRTAPLVVADILGATEVDPGAAEVAVRGNGVLIVDGDSSPAVGDHTDFGIVAVGGATVSRVYTVSNTGAAALTTSGLTVPTGYTVVEGLSASIAAGASDTFTVRLETASVGTKSGQISFATNDADENPFNFSVSGVVRTNSLPVIAGQTQLTLIANQWYRLDGLSLSFVDADSDPVSGEVKDMSAAAGSAYLWKGADVAQGGTATFANEAEFDGLWIRGGTGVGTNAFDIRATDGFGTTGWRTLTVKTAVQSNRAPVAVVNDQSVAQGAAIGFVVNPGSVADPNAQIVLSVSDADADTIQIYRFWDPAGGGQVRISGVAIAPNTSVDVAAANLGQVTYAGAGSAGSETLWLQVYDGETWSAWESWSERTLRATNTLPVIAGQTQLTLVTNQWYRLDGLNLSFTDADGDPLSGEVKDMSATAGSAYMWFKGTDVAQGGTAAFANEAEFDGLWIRGGAGVGTNAFDVRLNDGYGYTSWRTLTVKTAAQANRAPVAVVNDQSVAPGAAIGFVVNPVTVADPTAQIVLTVGDADADAIRVYRFWDPAGGGQIRISGVAITPNTSVDVAAANLGQVTYAGAGTAGSETLWLQVYDGESWSGWGSWNERTLRATNTLPVITGQTQLTVTVNQWYQAEGLNVTFTDADSDTIVGGEVKDMSAAAGSAYMWFNGAAAAQGATVTFANEAEFDGVWIRGGAGIGANAFDIRVTDGYGYTGWRTLTVKTAAQVNRAPVAIVNDQSVVAGGAVPLVVNVGSVADPKAQIVLSASDADADTIQTYRFWDPAGGGQIKISGVAITPNLGVAVAAANLSQVTYSAAGSAGAETLWVQAYDGESWSVWESWNQTTVRASNVAPVVNSVRGLLGVNEWLDAASMSFVVFSDADNDPWVLAEIRDTTAAANSGYLWFDGANIAANQVVQYSPTDVAAGKLWVRGGAIEISDSYELRVHDGIDWSAWRTATVVTRASNQKPAITASNGAASLGQSVAAAGLFSATDANADGLSRFRLWDGGTGSTSGYFSVGGVRQGAAANIELDFLQLAGAQFIGAAQAGSETVWAQAYDGREWSDWKSWTMTTLA